MIESLLLARVMIVAQERRQIAGRSVQRHNELLPAPEMSAEQLATFLKHKALLPEASYGDLLSAIQSGQKAYRNEVIKGHQKSYNELNWFQKLFAEAPSSQHWKLKPIPADYLMHRYQGKLGEFELFNALCELGEHRLITLDTQHPYRVGMTAKGKDVVRLLKDTAAPPSYSDVFQSSQSNAS